MRNVASSPSRQSASRRIACRGAWNSIRRSPSPPEASNSGPTGLSMCVYNMARLLFADGLWRVHRIAPQLDHRIRPPRPPGLGLRAQCLRVHPRAVVRDGTLQHQVVGGERVRMTECTQGNVMRRPRTDARQLHPACDEVVEHAFGFEIDAAVEQRARHGAYGVRARTGEADAAEVGFGQRNRCREQMFEPGCEWSIQRLAE